MITLYREFDQGKFALGETKMLDNGGKTVYVSYAGSRLRLQTPEMEAPFGITTWSDANQSDANAPKRYSLDLSFKGMADKKGLATFYEVMAGLDKRLIDEGVANSQSWFKKKITSKDVVEALYTPLVKYSRDKLTGEINEKYAPNIKIKVPFKDGVFACEAFDAQKAQIDMAQIDMKRAKVTAIIEATGIWIAGGKFGMSFTLKQARVQPVPSIKGYAFKDAPREDGDDGDDGGDIDDDDQEFH